MSLSGVTPSCYESSTHYEESPGYRTADHRFQATALYSVHTTTRRCKYEQPPPSNRQDTRSNNAHIQPRDTITRFLVINYPKKKKHQLLTMSSHFLWKQLETGFLMSVSYIYHTEIGRGEQITFFYCIEKRIVLYLRPAEHIFANAAILWDLLNRRKLRNLPFCFSSQSFLLTCPTQYIFYSTSTGFFICHFYRHHFNITINVHLGQTELCVTTTICIHRPSSKLTQSVDQHNLYSYRVHLGHDSIPYGVGQYQCFGETYRLNLQGLNKTLIETSV